MSITSSGRYQSLIVSLVDIWLGAGVWGTVDVICSRGAVVSMWLSSAGE